ncbi:MAG: sugar ABC transporter permease [Proteobacteria bacterium]|nr:sugar ABC transporter permease [Pseudomonadota bacterium]
MTRGAVIHRRRWRTTTTDVVAAVVFLLPFMVILVLFHYWPMWKMLVDSFYDFQLLNPAKRLFVGVENYTDVFSDPHTLQSFKVSLTFAVGVVVTVVPLSFLLAVYLNGRMPARGLVRTIVFLPVVTSVVVIATMWTFLLNPSNGLVNSALVAVGLGRHPFLTDVREALPAMVGVMLWQQLGFATILYLAGLQGIPAELDDAALADGASPLQRMWFVTIPLLARTTVFIVVVMTVFALQAFAPALIMTSGGPQGTTDFIVYNIYQTAFSLQQPGLASAMSVLMLAIVLVISLVQLRLLRTRWSY